VKLEQNNPFLPIIPERGALILHGLDSFTCLASDIRSALEELLAARPDVREYSHDQHVRRFVETTCAAVYRLGKKSPPEAKEES
jgi:hypothetical protein